jgi:DNA-binding NtrC family response regulator
MKHILVVDDEKNMCTALSILFENDGYTVESVSDGKDAIDLLSEGKIFDLIVSDLKMPGVDGIGLLNYLQERQHSIPLILITAYGTIEGAVEAMKLGAADFITKPFNKDIIRNTVQRLFRIEELEEENRELKEAIRVGRLVYRSNGIAKIMDTVKKVAPYKSPVLLLGESGSGKGIIAENLHEDKDKPFIRIHCPAIPETLIESELFGYRKGAFTGADKDFKGKIRMAEGGTLFLDEIGDLPQQVQPKLLRMLEEKTFEPLGSTTSYTINTRIICATNRDLESLAASGAFRQDLFYRINTITIKVPPLRNRKDDILPLAEFFLELFCKEMGKDTLFLDSDAKSILLEYTWPGNVRELKNVIERSVVLCRNKKISPPDLPLQLCPPREGVPKGTLAATEKSLLTEALSACDDNITQAAKTLGISRSTMRYRMSKYNL